MKRYLHTGIVFAIIEWIYFFYLLFDIDRIDITSLMITICLGGIGWLAFNMWIDNKFTQKDTKAKEENKRC